jgi:non-specific serine/threonine protein kinase
LSELGDRWWGTVCLEGLAGVAATQEKPERAAQLLGAAERLHDAMGAPVLPLFRPQYERTLSTTRAQLSEAQFAAARAEGRAMTFEQAVAHALGN